MSALTDIRAKIRQGLGRPFVYLGSEWDRMAPRERRWVAGLSIAVVTVAAMLGIYLTFTTIGDLEEGNADIREALAAVAKHRTEYLDAKARAQAQEARLGTDTPQLTADLESAAREEDVQIAETSERPPVPAGKKWIEHAVDLKIRGVDLLSLTEFMRRVETGTRPVFFTRLSLKRRYSEAEKLDAEVTATAFERVKEGASPARRPAITPKGPTP
jgi:general secretion pathway protein M